MRGITLWEGRARQFTIAGTLNVIGFGAMFGVAAATLRAALDAAGNHWRTRHLSRQVRSAIFAVTCLALAIVVLTPLTVHRLVLFPPVVALFLFAIEMCWRRWSDDASLAAPE